MNNKEEWLDISGYHGVYEISSYGRVRSYGNLLKSWVMKSGYASIQLCMRGISKSFRINRLVAIEFLNNPHNKLEVNHKDLNKLNNHVDNLEWCTHSENIKHSYANGRPKPWLGAFNKEHPASKNVYQYSIDNKFIKSFSSISNASKETNICLNSISMVALGKGKTAGKFIWKFIKT